MSKLVLSVDNLSNIWETENISILVDIFSKIIENMGKNELFSNESCLNIFETILLGKGISEIDTKIFLEIIDSKPFRKSYIETIRKIEYNGNIGSSNAEIIQRKNNPLFNMGELKTKLNLLIIKSRLTNAIEQDKPKNYIHYEGKKYIEIGGESFELLEKVGNIGYIKNKLDGTFGIYQENDGLREILLSGKQAIGEVENIGGKVFVTFEDDEGSGLYDISNKDVLLSGKEKNLKIKVIGGKVFTIFEDDEGNGLYDIFRREVLISGKKSVGEIINIGGRLFVYFKNRDNFVGVYNISIKEVILHGKKRISTIKNHGGNLFVDFEDNEGEGLYYINLSEVLLSGDKYIGDIEKYSGKLYVCFKNENGNGLYGISDKEVLLSGKELFGEIKYIGGRLFIYFEDKEGKGLYNISDKKVLLSGKKVIIYDKDRLIYKDKGIITFQKELNI